ncbi:hypothetical protein CEUSTIGMA_g9584.t1 [Chlamydomonas eustigma]|uniref:Uncharacterized protein n=1 Tax=Chlamydomonas eustigma TaxID=1157962 RepID=A0A250XGK0_9CHLO|nr:hypothetical protein CEUSTIGMA_g9584.t1 [Chlamydomonas eustigma]|eukprot:GAX82156.1 hypothetical protein CEUSTIGMA_g9584.t1 [Chlamydomonas eustigma]
MLCCFTGHVPRQDDDKTDEVVLETLPVANIKASHAIEITVLAENLVTEESEFLPSKSTEKVKIQEASPPQETTTSCVKEAVFLAASVKFEDSWDINRSNESERIKEDPLEVEHIDVPQFSAQESETALPSPPKSSPNTEPITEPLGSQDAEKLQQPVQDSALSAESRKQHDLGTLTPSQHTPTATVTRSSPLTAGLISTHPSTQRNTHQRPSSIRNISNTPPPHPDPVQRLGSGLSHQTVATVPTAASGKLLKSSSTGASRAHSGPKLVLMSPKTLSGPRTPEWMKQGELSMISPRGGRGQQQDGPAWQDRQAGGSSSRFFPVHTSGSGAGYRTEQLTSTQGWYGGGVMSRSAAFALSSMDKSLKGSMKNVDFRPKWKV